MKDVNFKAASTRCTFATMCMQLRIREIFDLKDDDAYDEMILVLKNALTNRWMYMDKPPANPQSIEECFYIFPRGRRTKQLAANLEATYDELKAILERFKKGDDLDQDN